MKNLTLFALFFFFQLALSSQTAIGPNLNNPRGLIVVDNYAYFLDNNRLERIDLDNPASTEVVIASLNYSSYTLEKSPQGFFIPNTGQNNVDEARINGTNVFPAFNYINGTGGTIGLAFQDEAGDTYFTRNGTSNSAQLRRLTNSPNTSSIVANMPAGVNDILDVATIGSEFYFSTAQGRIYRFDRNNPSAGFTLFLDLGVGAISGIEVTQDYIYYSNGSLVRRLRSNGGSPVFILNNANIINIDVKDNKVYAITRFLPNDRLYEWTDPNLPVPCSSVVNIPDANFKAALLANTTINTDGDNEICTTEAAAYNSTISIPGLNISDLTGIEAFVNLNELECYNNPITSLDLSSNTALRNLYCDQMQLTSIDLSQNTQLRILECTFNQLTNLDLSQNTQLRELNCSQNQLTTLTLPVTTALTDVDCQFNSLTSLDVSANAGLVNLIVYANNITTIDISNNTALEYFDCRSNLLTNLNVATNTSLTELRCSSNQLTNLDTSTNTALINLLCSNNQLSNLDVSSNTALESLSCGFNPLASLDVSANTALIGLVCNFNQLSNLDVSANTSLTNLNIANNQFTSIDLSSNTGLISLFCQSNQLTSLDLSSFTALEQLDCRTNQLTSLNVANTNNANMTRMWATGNVNLNCIQHDTGFDPTTNSNWLKDATANWSDNCPSTCTTFVNIPDPNFKAYLVGNTAINTDGDNEICITEAQAFTGVINTNNNSSITDLTGIEAFVNLTELRLFNNSLTSLDVSNNTALTVLACGRNSLTSLDVTNNTALTELICSFNSLTTLDITANTALIQLFCQDNSLTSLNVANGNNSNMTFMNAPDNPDLSCIQHDSGFDPTTNSNWLKDTTANWSNDCTTLSIQDNAFENTLKLYRNPANSSLNVSSNLYTIESIEIFSLHGGRIITSIDKTINVSSLSTGVYIIKIKGTDNRTAVKKFFIE